MFFTITKNSLILYALAFVMVTTAAVIMVFGIGDETAAEGDDAQKKIIVIDPGHGTLS